MQYHDPNGLKCAEQQIITTRFLQQDRKKYLMCTTVIPTFLRQHLIVNITVPLFSPSAVADCTADPTYTTLGGTETAVLEDAKSHFTENESELQPQHCPLEKETGEDGLQSPANPNAVYIRSCGQKKKKVAAMMVKMTKMMLLLLCR